MLDLCFFEVCPMLRYLPLILKNCWRNRRRTILTVASIGVSMCLLGVIIAMYHAFYMSNPPPAQASPAGSPRNRVSLTVESCAHTSRASRQLPCAYTCQVMCPTGLAARV